MWNLNIDFRVAKNVGDFRNITEIMDHFLDILEMYQNVQFCNPN